MSAGTQTMVGRPKLVGSDGIAWFGVAVAADLAPGSMLSVRVDGRNIAIYRLASGELRASDNRCTHAGASLADGWLDGDVVECPLHGGRFDLNTGRGLCSPVNRPVEVFPVKILDGRIAVALRHSTDT